MTKPVDIAVSRFAEGFSCSQAVFTAFAPRFDIPDELSLKLAASFGGGMARQGEVCGAVTGALMILGAGFGGANPEDKEAAYAVSQEFIQRFKERRKTILCRELIGYDMSNTEKLQQARESGVFKSICPLLVQESAEIVTVLLEAK